MTWDPLLAASRVVFDADAIAQAVARIAAEVTARCRDRDPVVLPVLLGGLPFAAALLPRLQFQLQLDYAQVSRYRSGTRGSALVWLRTPIIPLTDRLVLLVDDVLDDGDTLRELKQWCAAQGAAEVLAAVLVSKRSSRRAAGLDADFTGLKAGGEFLFGYGMDYEERYRHLPDIRALPKEIG